MPPEGIKKKEKAVRKKIVRRSLTHIASVQELPFFENTQFKAIERKKIAPTQCKVLEKKKVASRVIKSRKRKTKPERALRFPKPEFFAPPIIDSPEVQTQKSGETKSIGKITHYYDKIKVGVIEITGKISVGDCISYETADGETYEQIIESMEINRQPVFNAKKGDDIGIKLLKTPRIDTKVFKI